MVRISKETEGLLTPIVGADDTVKFKEIMEEGKEGILSWETYGDVLTLCLKNKAKKCALLLLNGEFGPRPSASLCPQILSTSFVEFCDPDVVRLILEECGANRCANEPYNGFLPIHTFLENTTSMFPLTKWARDESLITLTILLCHPALKERLEVAKLLAEHTDSLTDVAVGLLSNGDVAELAALLLVAHSSILEPLKSAPKIEVKDSADMVSRAMHGDFPNPAGLALINIFDKAGDDLSQYWSSLEKDVSPVDVVKDVATVIRKAGIPITPKDVDFSDVLCFEADVMDTVYEWLGFKKDDGSIDKKPEPVFHSVRSARYMLPREMFIPDEKIGNMMSLNYAVMKRLSSRTGRRSYATAATQAQTLKTSACWSRPPPSFSMPFLAMNLARAIKYL